MYYKEAKKAIKLRGNAEENLIKIYNHSQSIDLIISTNYVIHPSFVLYVRYDNDKQSK